MEWICCLLPIILFCISKSLAYVEIIQQSKNWFEASNECVNRGGKLADHNELHLRACVNKSLNVWIDTYNQERLTPWIANMGCFVTTKRKKLRTSLFECYLLCKSTPFGYQEPWCTCEDELPVDFVADAPCITKNSDGNNGNYIWLYDKTEVDLSDDEYRMDCITAMCKENITRFRTVDCGEHKIVYCQSKDFIIRYKDTNSQANSEKTCKDRSFHLVSNGIYGFCEQKRDTPEFWTGIKRFRYNDTGRLTDRVRCVYVRCQNRSGQETFKNCRQHLDGFACNISGTSNYVTVKPRPTSVFTSAIIRSSDSSSLYVEYVSTKEPLQSKTEGTVLRKGRVSTYAQSTIEHALLSTSLTPVSLSYHTPKHTVSAASFKTSLISTKTNTIDMSMVVYSSFVTTKNTKELKENSIMHGTTTRNSSSSKINQSRTGLIVGVTVSLLVVMTIGLFIACRLRHIGPFKEKAEDFTIQITKTTDPNYHDIGLDLEKETNFIDNDSTNNFPEIKCDNIQFKAIDNTQKGKTNTHNNPYAVVVKDRISGAIKTKGNQDKDENRSSNVSQSDYYSLNQSRRISGDESCNIYDTSNGNTDDKDPTYNTTTHLHAIERTNESDYDRL